jgi:endonuclease/exonuclease/phosphatase family metal-dependent hydrolase
MRVVSWNIHGCVGIDGRFDPLRVASVLARLAPDLALLQEVGQHRGPQRQVDQARVLAAELSMICAVGVTVEAGPYGYGLATLARHAILDCETFDLSVRGREPRACLRIVTSESGASLSVFNVHLGLAWGERRRQIERMLASGGPLGRADLPALCAGDFNDWPPGPVTRLLGRRMRDVGIVAGRTFPSPLALFRLDRIYAGRGLAIAGAAVDRSATARLASDHLPVYADLQLDPAALQGDPPATAQGSSSSPDEGGFERSRSRVR